MSKKYVDYKVEDLVLDDSFLNWILNGEDDMFWAGLLKENKELSDEVNKAKELIFAFKSLQNDIPVDYDVELRRKVVWGKVNEKLGAKKSKKRNLRPVIIGIAATLMLFVGVGSLLYIKYIMTDEQIQFAKVDMKEAGEVQLFLADGSTIDIDDTERDIEEEDGTQITNKSNRTLVYNSATKSSIFKKEIYNQIVIPRGKRHNLVLGDGTKVWVNSESKLRFPTQFVNNKRIVFLEGEAYFDVAPNKDKPFIVKTPDLDINVRGTAFNVKTYDSDNLCETTLEEGLVEITKDGNSDRVLLEPGKKATYSKSDKTIYIEKVDTKLYTSWRTGKYVFSSERLESLIITINRWYNVDVHCDDADVLNYKFTGVISEDRSIEHIMELIHLTAKVNYNFEGDTIFITK